MSDTVQKLKDERDAAYRRTQSAYQAMQMADERATDYESVARLTDDPDKRAYYEGKVAAARQEWERASRAFVEATGAYMKVLDELRRLGHS